jgi:hypothetical protein
MYPTTQRFRLLPTTQADADDATMEDDKTMEEEEEDDVMMVDDAMYAKGKGTYVFTKGYTTTTKGYVYATKGAHENSFARLLSLYDVSFAFLSPRSFELHAEIRVALLPRAFLHDSFISPNSFLVCAKIINHFARTNTHVAVSGKGTYYAKGKGYYYIVKGKGTYITSKGK